MEKKKCEFCKEIIHINTRRCPFCGSIVSEIPEEVIKDEMDNITTISNGDGEIQEKQTEVPDPIPIEDRNNIKPSGILSNGKKVFITVMSTILPGLGQIYGIIFSIILMSDKTDNDKRSFGKALMICSVIVLAVFGLCCIAYTVFTLDFISKNPNLFYKYK